MADRRKKNANWTVADEAGQVYSGIKDGCVLATLMDIRDELQQINRVLACPNFRAMPHELTKLRRITERFDRRFAKRRKK